MFLLTSKHFFFFFLIEFNYKTFSFYNKTLCLAYFSAHYFLLLLSLILSRVFVPASPRCVSEGSPAHLAVCVSGGCSQ